MSNVQLRMLADKVHLLIKSLNACHICLSIICELYLMAAAHALCTPVEISHVYRTADLTGDSVETGLPTLYRLACSLWCKCKVNDLLCLHLSDYAECYTAASLSVDRNTTHLTEKPAERTYEKIALHHAVRFSSH